MKNIVILGSTGSLGIQTLEVLQKYPHLFQVIGLSAHTNEKLLNQQAQKFSVPKKNILLSSQADEEKIADLAALKQADIIINVLPGLSGIVPTIAALKANKILLQGNKESIVAEGEKIMKLANSRDNSETHAHAQPHTKAKLIPLDSEHNAIYEILQKFPHKKIKSILIPCSGGPFLNKSVRELTSLTAKDALAHPKWKMGEKVTIESATLLNKGLEVIEAHYLFDLPLNRIKVIIHPECLVHGMVEFESETSVTSDTFAYISAPDMREHIENALLTAINHPLPPREIRPLKPNEFIFQKIPSHLPGIKIILNAFKKNPSQIKKFLQKEEKIISLFLQNKIKFPEVFRELS